MATEITIMRRRGPAKKKAVRGAAVKRTRKVVRAEGAKRGAGAKLGGVSSAAVAKATGRTWEQWLTVLDRAGAQKLPHKQIAEMVAEKFGAGPWWSQMVTVGYEQARGLREKHQTADGYQISGSRTVGVPVAMLYEAWADPKLREKWLSRRDLVVRKATPRKSMRITWDASKGAAATSVEVNFYARGPGRSMVQLGHRKIRTRATGERLKAFWAQRLLALKGMLEL